MNMILIALFVYLIWLVVLTIRVFKPKGKRFRKGGYVPQSREGVVSKGVVDDAVLKWRISNKKPPKLGVTAEEFVRGANRVAKAGCGSPDKPFTPLIKHIGPTRCGDIEDLYKLTNHKFEIDKLDPAEVDRLGIETHMYKYCTECGGMHFEGGRCRLCRTKEPKG